jgi:hypothetical protein
VDSLLDRRPGGTIPDVTDGTSDTITWEELLAEQCGDGLRVAWDGLTTRTISGAADMGSPGLDEHLVHELVYKVMPRTPEGCFVLEHETWEPSTSPPAPRPMPLRFVVSSPRRLLADAGHGEFNPGSVE